MTSAAIPSGAQAEWSNGQYPRPVTVLHDTPVTTGREYVSVRFDDTANYGAVRAENLEIIR